MFCIIGIHLKSQDTVRIFTSAQCESCKNRLESRLVKQKGVQSVDLDISSKVLTIIYQSSTISKEALEEKVTEIGYEANGRPAKKAAYKRLPLCCRKDYQGAH